VKTVHFVLYILRFAKFILNLHNDDNDDNDCDSGVSAPLARNVYLAPTEQITTYNTRIDALVLLRLLRQQVGSTWLEYNVPFQHEYGYIRDVHNHSRYGIWGELLL